MFNDMTISDELAVEFALKAAQLRFGKEAKLSPEMLLFVERQEDAGNSMWAVLNRVQEKLVNGG